VHYLETISAHFSLVSGPLASALILFFLPAFLLGMLSPFAIKLLTVHVPDEGVGSISGKVFFWSTVGSILGSLLAAFVLIPRLGIDRIVVSVGMAITLLGLSALIILKTKKKFVIPAIVLATLLSSLTVAQLFEKDLRALYKRDGVYEEVAIYITESMGFPQGKFLMLKQDLSPSGWMYLDSDEHVADYTKYYVLYKIFTPKAKDILAIGGGGYAVPKAYYKDIPDAIIDVVEIEPSLFDLAKKYFRVPTSDRLRNHVADGRRFLKDSEKKYDVIFGDAYYSLACVPPHLTTKEFFELTKSQLKDDGIFIGNFYGDLTTRSNSLMHILMKTFNSVFDNSYYFATTSPAIRIFQNIIFVGYNSDQRIDFKNLDLKKYNNALISSLPRKLINVSEIDFSVYPLFTDNYSPTEYFTAAGLRFLPKLAVSR
jgi:spermidine synthase